MNSRLNSQRQSKFYIHIDRLYSLIWILVLSTSALLTHGYKFNTSDQKIVIPFIEKTIQPALFPNDLLFMQSSAYSSLFYGSVAFATKFINIETLFFISYLVCQFLLFLGIYLLAREILPTKRSAMLAIFPFLLPKFVAGLLTFTYDNFFLYRIIGLIFLLFFLRAVIRKQFYIASLIAAVGTLIHPISFLPTVLILPVATICLSKNKLITTVLAGGIYAAIVLPDFFLLRSNLSLSLSGLFDRQWMAIIRERDNYLSVRTWSLMDWTSFWFYLAMVSYFFTRLNIQAKKFVAIVVVSCLAVFALSVILVDVFNIPTFAQFQLLRSFTPIAYLGLILTPLFLTSDKKISGALGLACFICLIVNAYILFLALFTLLLSINMIPRFSFSLPLPVTLTNVVLTAAIFYLMASRAIVYSRNNRLIEYPDSQSDWDRVQIWANEKTTVSDTFIVPTDQTGFRVYSKRSLIADYKDGAVVAYSPVFAKEWSKRMSDLENYRQFSNEDFQKLSHRYRFDFVVTIAGQKLSFPVVYRNGSFTVYQFVPIRE